MAAINEDLKILFSLYYFIMFTLNFCIQCSSVVLIKDIILNFDYWNEVPGQDLDQCSCTAWSAHPDCLFIILQFNKLWHEVYQYFIGIIHSHSYIRKIPSHYPIILHASVQFPLLTLDIFVLELSTSQSVQEVIITSVWSPMYVIYIIISWQETSNTKNLNFTCFSWIMSLTGITFLIIISTNSSINMSTKLICYSTP